MRISFEQSLAEIYTILLEEHVPSCFRDVGGGNLFLTLVSKTDQSGSMVFDYVARKDVEGHLYALQTMTE
jgi:hypothetical protein